MKARSTGSPRPARITLAAAAGVALLMAAFAAGRAGVPGGSPAPGPEGGAAGRTAAGYAFGGMPADGRLPSAEGWYAAAFGEGTAASGLASAALGSGSEAAGHASLAGGLETRAGGDYATALGARSEASGYAATALGYGTAATGDAATALGHATVASGDRSIALGSYASTAGRIGAFVYGDNSTTDTVAATRDHEFLVRASGGVTFRAGPGAVPGVTLRPGSGSWSSVVDESSVAEAGDVDVDALLSALAGLELATWRFAGEPAGTRHVGPTARAFARAFGLGDESAIATVDGYGVALAAAQGLAARTAELRETVEALSARIEALELALADRAAGGRVPDGPAR